MSQDIRKLFQYTEEMSDTQPSSTHQQAAGQPTKRTSDNQSNPDQEKEFTPKDPGTKVVKDTGLVKLPITNKEMDINIVNNPSMFTPLEQSKKHNHDFPPPSPDLNPTVVNRIESLVADKFSVWESKLNKIVQVNTLELQKVRGDLKQISTGITEGLKDIKDYEVRLNKNELTTRTLPANIQAQKQKTPVT